MSISSWLRARPVTESPTTSIYFSEFMREEIGVIGSSKHRIWALSPNVFYVPDETEPRVLVIRDLDLEAWRRLETLPQARIHYLLDDDIWAGCEDPALPRAYRKRLQRLRDGNARWLTSNAEKIYVSSERLCDRLTSATLVHPGLIFAPPELTHHDEPRLRLVFMGTRSHLRDLESIERALMRFLADHPDCVFETYLGRFAPASLRLPNAVHHAPQSWAGYRSTLAERRYHVALAPMLPTAFNAARSHSKALEISYFGAAPVYSASVPFADLVKDAGAGFFCESGAWYDLLTKLAMDRGSVLNAAAANRRMVQRIGSPSGLREFWRREFGFDLTSSGMAKHPGIVKKGYLGF